MKTFKNIANLLLIATLFFAVSCKKNSVKPEEENPNQNLANSVSATDLESYYLVGQTNHSNKLFVLYFVRENGTLKAHMHKKGQLRILDAVVNNSKFVFDFDNNGNSLYNFEFEKNAANIISLKNYSLINSNTGLKFEHAILVKKSESPIFANSSYKIGNLSFNVTNANSLEWNIKMEPYVISIVNGVPIRGYKATPEFTKPFYTLDKMGFKSNDDVFLGISVPYWKNSTTPILLIENNSSVNLAIKQ